MPISSTTAESAQPAPRFRDLNAGKANFDEAYDRPDPRAYAAVLGKLGYCVPSEALPVFRRTIHDAGLEGTVIAVVADSPTLGRHWTTPLGFLFIDGGHGTEPAHRDYETWVPHVAVGGILAIHDVFPDPADGGRPPYEIYLRAIESGAFEEVSVTGSLRVLRRTAPGV